MSDSVWPHRRQPTRFPRPWDSPGKNTGVGCHFLLQCMKVKSESEVAQSCPTFSDPMDCSPPGSSIHGIFQARVLEWGAIAFSGIFTVNYLRMALWYQLPLRSFSTGRIESCGLAANSTPVVHQQSYELSQRVELTALSLNWMSYLNTSVITFLEMVNLRVCNSHPQFTLLNWK